MIPVNRPIETEPSALRQVFRDGDTELDRAVKAFSAFLVERQTDPDLRFKFEHKRYRSREVRAALESLFHGKCAYCEQRYASLHPMDVEHWRPKAMAQFGEHHGESEHGYWWLAADWENLLPSCIDCNRGRKHQIDVESGERVMMGKANQFPLHHDSTPALGPDDELVSERPLLLNPCEPGFDPAENFSYEEGIIVGLTERAKASIRVYALNRPELVHEREAVAKLFEHRLAVLTDIAVLVAETRRVNGDPLDPERTLVEQMHDQVRADLFAMAEPTQPFAGMIQFLLRTVAQELTEAADGG